MKHITFFLISFLFISISAVAQKTSTVYTQDTTGVVESEYDRMYRLFLGDKKRIYTIFKINAVDWGVIKPSVIIEQNIGKNLNIEPKVRLAAFDWSFSDGVKYAFESGADLKYYYNYNRRNKLGKKTNGFNGNYFALGGSFLITDYIKHIETRMLNHNIAFKNPLRSDIYQVWSADVKYGFQRRIGSLGYIDVKAGLRYLNYVDYGENVIPFVEVGIGFGLTKDKMMDIIR